LVIPTSIRHNTSEILRLTEGREDERVSLVWQDKRALEVTKSETTLDAVKGYRM
jgi:hypothetical protein